MDRRSGAVDAGIADALLVALVALPVALWLSACGWMIERDDSALSRGGTLFTVLCALLVATTIAAAAVLGTRAVISAAILIGVLLCAGAVGARTPAVGALSAIVLVAYVASGMWITGRALDCWDCRAGDRSRGGDALLALLPVSSIAVYVASALVAGRALGDFMRRTR